MRITEEYRRANLLLHQSNPKYGTSGVKWTKKVERLIAETAAATVLDYGCGKGLLKAALPDANIREYDPAVPGKDAEPEPADLVVCTDVLEHIEPDCLDEVLGHLRQLALKYVFANISTRAAVKYLEDGRNAHLIIQPPEWWLTRLKKYFEIVEWTPTPKHAGVNALLRPLH